MAAGRLKTTSPKTRGRGSVLPSRWNLHRPERIMSHPLGQKVCQEQSSKICAVREYLDAHHAYDVWIAQVSSQEAAKS
jgi:hypothetical protein